MIPKRKIEEIVKDFNEKKVVLATLCSHSALQLINGAKQEGFKTLAICPKSREKVYKSFPLAKADEYLFVDKFEEILQDSFQEKLREKNALVIPHGSFVEYVGPKKLRNDFYVPIYGNRASLEWEGDREKERRWLKKAGATVPEKIDKPSQINKPVFVKFSGAKGGRGFFIAESKEEFEEKIQERLNKGLITEKEAEDVVIQEFLPGNRFYPHFFNSFFEKKGLKTGESAIELLGMDKRVETIDEAYRGLPDIPSEFFDYTVTGNESVVVRESLLRDLFELAEGVIETSRELFSPGLIGPFCLETVFHPDHGFTVFEISGRIVAGTNLFPQGSPYSWYYFDKPMSTGRRIAREIKKGLKNGELEKIVY